MKKYLFLTFLFCIMLCSLSLADELYFKDGNKVSGRIVKEDKYAVKIMLGDQAKVYRKDNIAEIRRDEHESSSQMIEFANMEKNELIMRLLEVNKTRSNMVANIQRAISDLTASEQEAMLKIVNIDAMMSQIVPIYSRYYTKDEIQGLIEFFLSPLGQKYLARTPEILKAGIDSLAEYFNALKREQQQALQLQPPAVKPETDNIMSDLRSK